MLTNLSNKAILPVTDEKSKKKNDKEPEAEVKPAYAEPVVETKIEKPKSSTINERVAALETVVYSAFALREDGTARKLKRSLKR